MLSPSRRPSKNTSTTPSAANGPPPRSAPAPKAHNLTLVWMGLCGLCVAGLGMALVEASAGEGARLSSGSSLEGSPPAVEPAVDGDKGKTQERAKTKRRVRNKKAEGKAPEPVKDADPVAQERKRAADVRIKALSERLRKEREERARKRARQRKCEGKGKGGGKGGGGKGGGGGGKGK